MATLRGQMAQASGIPLGGLGTGSIEIQPDGYFHEWQIFNLGRWAPYQPETIKTEGPQMPPGALAFYVRTRQDAPSPYPLPTGERGNNGTLMRRLGVRSDQHDLYGCSWLHNVHEIEFEGCFPVASLKYVDADLPVSVSARMFSPFVPHDSRTSGTPGFYAAFRVKNCSCAAVEVSLLGTLCNPLAALADERQLTNNITRQGATTHLTMRTAATTPNDPTIGSLDFSVSGGETSWIAGEYPNFMRSYAVWGDPYGLANESFIHRFRATGRLPSLSGSRSPAAMLRFTDEEIVALPATEKKRLVQELLRYTFAHDVHERILEADSGILSNDEKLATFLKSMRHRLNDFAGKERKDKRWGESALAAAVTLAPGEEREIVFTLAWYFPHHFSAKGPELGHMYENWFKDAGEVGQFLAANRESLTAKTCAFAKTLFDTTLDPVLADAWAGQLTTLPKCTWWTKKGDFAVWEGLGCCGFHTTDITYQGSFNILALFPDLQKSQMEMGARFQRADGRVHHFFTPDLTQVDNGFDRVDMNQQFVLLATRDYLWTGDRAYLRRLWPHILRAMDNTAQLDLDGDGLPDHDTSRNTYDAWNFFGTPSYIASLWLSALLAAVRDAEDLGHQAQAARWRKMLKKGSASFEKKLWNGEYFSLWVDGKVRDDCCMTDQVDGEWFTRLVGLGNCLPDERVRAALAAVMRYNFSPEAGLLNATYPPGKPRRVSTHRNCQATAPWTGIEYAIASMLFDYGMAGAALDVVRNIHERYLRAGRFWNHVECGDHYYRAMSSWAILLGATGFKIDVPRATLTIAPAFLEVALRAPWVSASGWGYFEQTADKFTLVCETGDLAFKELRLNLAAGKHASAEVAGRRANAVFSRRDGLTVLNFARAVALSAGETLTVVG